MHAWGGWHPFVVLCFVRGQRARTSLLCCVECGHRWGWVVSNADTVGLGLPREKNREEVYIIRDIIRLFLRKDYPCL